MLHYSDIIVMDPNIRFGKPSVKNTRITVSDVLGWLASGMSVQEIFHDYPSLNDEAVRACLAYAADREDKLKIAG